MMDNNVDWREVYRRHCNAAGPSVGVAAVLGMCDNDRGLKGVQGDAIADDD